MADIRNINFDTFCKAIEGTSEKFGKKMRRGLIDDKCQDIIKAFYYEGEPVAFIATKHIRNYSNLKWVMTLPEARGKGAFRALCDDAVRTAWDNGCQYFRVSINAPALGAYEKCGFQVCGKQRGDCYLSAGKLTSPYIEYIDWKVDDQIWKWINQKPRGGCIEIFVDPPENKQETLF